MAFQEERVFSRSLTTRTHFLLFEIIWYSPSYIFSKICFLKTGWTCPSTLTRVSIRIITSPAMFLVLHQVCDGPSGRLLTCSPLFTLSFFGEMKINATCGILIVSLPIISERPLLFFSASVGLSHETTSFNGNDSLPITHPYPQVHGDVTVSSVFLPVSVSCLGKPTKYFSYILTQFLEED